MAREQALQTLVQQLNSLSAQLDPAQHGLLKGEITKLQQYRTRSAFRIVVFGPFNYGKSTLLNALLGQKTLPMDLVPTTGATIQVGYGPELHSRIRLADGSMISEPGIEVLKQYAILDDRRRMREDVVGVEVSCPHPLLEQGVELMDLPGTDDREEQDQVVQAQLLRADLILQVLDGRKLMTLVEREQLRDWLQDQGIETVVFVVNFLNLMEEEEQKQVSNRMRFVAESFRSKLPEGVSNLYRVDALPALRAQMQGDGSALQISGLPVLYSAIQTIVEAYKDDRPALQIPQVTPVAYQLVSIWENRARRLRDLIEGDQDRRNKEVELKQKAQSLIQRGFDQGVQDLRRWLDRETLMSRYHGSAQQALREFDFENWLKLSLELEWGEYRRQIVNWIDKAANMFKLDKPATDLALYIPDAPQVNVPPPPPSVKRNVDGTPVALAAGVGWLLGGPVGAAVLGGASYLINQSDPSGSSRRGMSPEQYERELEQAFDRAATQFLTQFSAQGLSTLERYIEATRHLIRPEIKSAPVELSEQRAQLQEVEGVLTDLKQALEQVEALQEPDHPKEATV